jgi:hypothetical protein
MAMRDAVMDENESCTRHEYERRVYDRTSNGSRKQRI